MPAEQPGNLAAGWTGDRVFQDKQGHADIPILGNSSLLLLVLVVLTVIPLIPPGLHRLLFGIVHSMIFILAALSLRDRKKHVLFWALGLVVFEWIAYLVDASLLSAFCEAAIVVFFLFIVLSLIRLIASTKTVTHRTILAAINGYLLMGLAFSFMVGFVVRYRPEAYRFPTELPAGASRSFAELSYYGFVTFTTVGYGDITPVEPYARSLAILNGISGQIYVAVIIAMLVGKLATQRA